MTRTAPMTSNLLGTLLSSSVQTLGSQVVIVANEAWQIFERPASSGGGIYSPRYREDFFSVPGLPLFRLPGPSTLSSITGPIASLGYLECRVLVQTDVPPPHRSSYPIQWC
jgi:hypothetical protein